MAEERKPYGGLTEAEIDAIAQRAALKAFEHMYAAVGKNVLRKLAWLLGAAIVSLAMWLAGNGIMKP